MKKQPQVVIARDQLLKVYRTAVGMGMPLSVVDQKVQRHLQRVSATQQLERQNDSQKVQKINTSIPLSVRIGAFFVPFLLISVGVYLLGSAVAPILAYYTHGNLDVTQERQLSAPIPEDQVLSVTPLLPSQSASSAALLGQPLPTPQIIDVELDYTNLANWFADAQLPQVGNSGTGKEQEFILDIPKVKISNAKVTVGGTDLNKSLISYQGTALPGEFGSPVIFGHSVLRQFYNPSEKNPRRYTSIFSYIMTLKPGDEIYVTHNGVKYTYIVREKTEVKPEDVHILTQRYDVKQLKLVTCTPEGTYLRRGVVTAELVDSKK